MTRLKEIDAQLASIENTMNEYSKIKTELQCERVLLICPYKIGDILVNKIEALIERFGKPMILGLVEAEENTHLIRASCENIYQSGYLQGKYDALQESLKAFKEEAVPKLIEGKI